MKNLCSLAGHSMKELLSQAKLKRAMEFVTQLGVGWRMLKPIIKYAFFKYKVFSKQNNEITKITNFFTSKKQVLCGCNPVWIPTEGGNVPPNAIPGGETEDGETLFIGRAPYEGTVTIGKVQQSHGVLYIPFGGEEISIPEYEILVNM